MKCSPLCCAFLLLSTTATLTITPLQARDIPISDPSKLAQLNNAAPGDVVILKNGTWKDARLFIKKGGNDKKPVVIRAETPGEVILAGNSSIEIEAPFVTVDGVLFKNGSFVEKGNKTKSVVTFLSHHGSLVNSAIVDFNPPSPTDEYYWVFFSGANNTVSKCFFKGKTNMSPLVGNDNLDAAKNNSVTGCYFKDIPVSDVNGREIIRVWGYGKSGDMGPGGAFFTIEGNLFERADGEGGEIISLKSNRNRVLRNTIVSTEGWVNIRQGHYNLVEGNVILANGVKKAYGLRMSGQYNEVKNNLLDGCSEGISISCGDYIDKDLTGSQEKHSAKRKDADGKRIPDEKLGAAAFSAQYPQNKYLKLTGNMVIACSGTDLDVGARYKAHWPKEQMILIPEECRIENNIFIRPNGGDSVVGTTPSKEPPLDQFKFTPNIFVGNKLYGGVNKFAPAAAGCESLSIPEGWSREKAIATFKPLTAEQVGPAWIRGKSL